MFDKREERLAILADLRRRLGADGVKNYDVTLRQTEVLAAPGPLAGVLPDGGLRRGTVLSLGSEAPGRAGGTSLLLTLLAAPRDIWCAVVGLPDLGLVAASEMGVDLSRLGLVPDPGPDIAQVISVLADGVDLIAAASPLRQGLSPVRQRVLTGRLRESGAVLLVVGQWPGADLSLTVTEVRWSGIGRGHGRLRDRELDVTVSGRRLGASRAVTLSLRAEGDAVRVIEPADEGRHTGSPAAQAAV